MRTFTIDTRTYETRCHATLESAIAGPDAVYFRVESELAEISAQWPLTMFVGIWNQLPGVTPVRKFTDRLPPSNEFGRPFSNWFLWTNRHRQPTLTNRRATLRRVRPRRITRPLNPDRRKQA